MALSDYKITDNAVGTKGVVAAPDKLTGTANQNKMIFDRLIREAVKGLYNGLIDALAGAEGAAEIGLDVEGLDAETVAEGIAELAAELSTKAEAADVTAALALKADASALDAHTENTGNPHSVSKDQVGLGNVDNTSDTDKPISTATQAALDGKQETLTFDTTPTANSTNPVTSGGVKTALDAKLSRSGGTMSGAIAMGSNKITGIGTPTEGADAATKSYVDDEISANHDIYFCTYGTTTYAEITAALAAGRLPVCVMDGVELVYTKDIGAALDFITGYCFQGVNNSSSTAAIYRAVCGTDSEWYSDSVSLATAQALSNGLADKQDTLTFDTTPTAGSTKPVTSAGIKTALDGKQSKLTFDASPTSGSSNPVKSSGIKTALNNVRDYVKAAQIPIALSASNAAAAARDAYSRGACAFVVVPRTVPPNITENLILYMTSVTSNNAFYFSAIVDGNVYGISLTSSSWGSLTQFPLGGA